jgi:hypothetical protein
MVTRALCQVLELGVTSTGRSVGNVRQDRQVFCWRGEHEYPLVLRLSLVTRLSGKCVRKAHCDIRSPCRERIEVRWETLC